MEDMSEDDLESPILNEQTSKSRFSASLNPVDYLEKLDIFDEDEPRDESQQAKLWRRKLMFRALWAEFMATCCFLIPIFGGIANGVRGGWDAGTLNGFVCLLAGLCITAVTFAFSDMSGANCNCAISFALWLSGGLSNRKLVTYSVVQILGSIVSTAVVVVMFEGPIDELTTPMTLTPTPGASLYKAFFTEFFCTFLLTYLAFTVVFEEASRLKADKMSVKSFNHNNGLTLYASTPQSKAGFAPFAIGFIVFALAMIGGSSGSAMNPCRILGPAIFSGKWDYFYLYVGAQYFGAGTAAILASSAHKYGVKKPINSSTDVENEKTSLLE